MRLGDIIAGDSRLPGATPVAGGTNFAVHPGADATGVAVCIVDPETKHIVARKSLRERSSEGVWHGFIPGVQEGALYGLYVDGPWQPAQGLKYNPHKFLVDPYARAIEGGVDWKEGLPYGYQYFPRDIPDRDLRMDTRDSIGHVPYGRVVDWQTLVKEYGGAKPKHSLTESVIIEAHPKGATMLLPMAERNIAGSYQGLSSPEFIAWLKEHEVTHLQLMPVHVHVDDHFLVDSGRSNYWGYMTLGFFAPHAGYGKTARPEIELLESLKKLRENGIDVIMDVVYGHTCESDHLGPTLSFRGVDDAIHHRAENPRYYTNPTGCGNAIDFSNPKARQIVGDSLDYWKEFVAGFRFDHGTTLGRENGAFNPAGGMYPIIQSRLDGHHKVGEPWDCESYALGEKLPFTPFNDKAREYIKQTAFGRQGAKASELSRHMAGSEGIIPAMGVNYVSSHDDKTLLAIAAEMMGYDRDAMGQPAVQREVQGRMQFAMSILAVSLGVPMIPLGHPAGQSNDFCRNTYDTDNATTWTHWKLEPWQEESLRFTREALNFRRRHPELQRQEFLTGQPYPETRKRDVTWYNPQGNEMTIEDWKNSQCFSYVLSGKPQWVEASRRPRVKVGRDIYIAVNASDSATGFVLPPLPAGERWKQALNSRMNGGELKFPPSHMPAETLFIPGRTLVACEGGRQRTINILSKERGFAPAR